MPASVTGATTPHARRDSAFKIGLVQMSCTLDMDENLRKAVSGVREAAGQRRADRLPAGTVPLAVLLPRGERRAVRPGRTDSRPVHGDAWRSVAKELQVVVIASLFERRAAGPVSQHGRRSSMRTARLLGLYRKMHIPDDPLYYEKFYFTPGDLGFRSFDTKYRAHRRAGVLGPVVSGSRAADRPAAARNVLFYPTAIGWHPSEKAAVRRGAARRVAAPFSASHAIANGVYVAAVNRVGLRGPAGARAGVLGRLVRGGSVRAGHRRGLARPRRDPGGRVRSAARSKRCGATGRSCATGASMPMRRS